jgi:hypothetical protein
VDFVVAAEVSSGCEVPEIGELRVISLNYYILIAQIINPE